MQLRGSAECCPTVAMLTARSVNVDARDRVAVSVRNPDELAVKDDVLRRRADRNRLEHVAVAGAHLGNVRALGVRHPEVLAVERDPLRAGADGISPHESTIAGSDLRDAVFV